jgi:hypothetical protein
MQKALGYRFVLEAFSYPKRLNPGELFSISFVVRNTGSSPFYYDWPVEISLLHPDTREVVWSQQLQDVDIRTWLPGENWGSARRAYAAAPEAYTVNQNLKIPDLAPGAYILAVAVLDPAGNLPSLRSAVENYYEGGRHPIGRVGVGKTIHNFKLDAFDSLRLDETLRYEVPSLSVLSK